MEEEVWKDIPGWENEYQASTLGRIRSVTKKVPCLIGKERIRIGRILSFYILKNGYYAVKFSRDSIKSNQSVHRLIALSFISNPENKREVNHKNGNKLDNNISNLDWMTPKENSRHSWDTGLSKAPYSMLGKFGKNHHCSKLIGQFTPLGELVNIYWGTNEASRATGLWANNIGRAAQGKVKMCGGYVWKYAFEEQLKQVS